MTLPCFYLPPVAWFAQAIGHEKNTRPLSENRVITLETLENFTKQTLRNRCYIDSPNGKLALSIPIDKSNFSQQGKCLMRDVRISRQYNWQHQHWTAFVSSYSMSPFFEFLQDDFLPIYQQQWTFLIDLNETLIERCFALLDVAVEIKHSEQFTPPSPSPHTTFTPYYQVFADKHGFIENLSIVDLLFNMGNEAPLYL